MAAIESRLPKLTTSLRYRILIQENFFFTKFVIFYLYYQVGICDISADPGGSIEFMKECTTIDHPFCLYDAENNTNMESFGGNGVLVCSIDNMPTELPREATEFFGSLLMPHLDDMVRNENTNKN
jgi:alanine dehydrogenase